MLKPSVQVHEHEGILIAEFWDCWRLDPAPVQDLRSRYEAHCRRQGRPELTLEHEIGQPSWAGLFTDAERDEASRRLTRATDTAGAMTGRHPISAWRWHALRRSRRR